MKLTGQEPKLDFEGCNKEEIRCNFCGKLCDTHKWKAEHEKWHRLHNAEKSDNLDLVESEEHDLIRTSRCGLKSTFPCAECGKILHSNFKRKLHQRRHQAQRLAAKNSQSMITAQKKKDSTPSLDCKTCGIRCPSLKAKAIHVAWHIEMKKKQAPPRNKRWAPTTASIAARSSALTWPWTTTCRLTPRPRRSTSATTAPGPSGRSGGWPPTSSGPTRDRTPTTASTAVRASGSR